MSFLDDKIRKIGEFVSQGEQSADKGAFYVFLVPKSGVEDSLAIFNARVTGNNDATDVPFMVGSWNPVVVSMLNVTSDLLGKFRIFWGAE